MVENRKLLHDVFICHASEDKDGFVRPLAEALRARHLDVWYDEFTLSVGGSLREAIDRGLAQSRFGIVVLSPNFFQKRWPQRELNGLVAREIAEERPLVLPIWHLIERDEILQHSPPLADVLAVSSARGLEVVVSELLRTLRPEESPLVVARDFLISKGLSPPPVTDEWWLDIVEVKEGELRFPDLNLGRRWIFPLPFPGASRGKERGLNIASTALQLDWAAEGEAAKLCQLTHPERVHEFLRSWPGLMECARANPAVLAMYVPQLTIPGFDNGLSDAFDVLLDTTREDTYDFRYGRADTIDGEEPLCGDLIAWRHPTLGNFTEGELANSFVNAHNAHYSRQVFNNFECLAWLLGSDSRWMPERLRESLLQGMKTRARGWSGDIFRLSPNKFADALLDRPRKRFVFSREIRSALNQLFQDALQELDISENPKELANKFIDRGFVDGFYDERDRWRATKKK